MTWLKENEQKANNAHAGVGSVSHTTCLLFNSVVGVKVAGAWQVVLGTDLRVRTRDDDDLGDIDVPPAKR